MSVLNVTYEELINDVLMALRNSYDLNLEEAKNKITEIDFRKLLENHEESVLHYTAMDWADELMDDNWY